MVWKSRRCGQAGDYRDLNLTAGPSARPLVRKEAFSYQLSAVSFMNHDNSLYYSRKSIGINQM
jgi:hypothetical protein